MIDEHNVVAVSRFDGDAYKSSQAAELTLNAAILRAEIARSNEEFLEIFETFYADDVEVSSEDSRETIHGKERVRTLLLNFLIPLHVMAYWYPFDRPRFLEMLPLRHILHGPWS
jgi:hypothetical protein